LAQVTVKSLSTLLAIPFGPDAIMVVIVLPTPAVAELFVLARCSTPGDWWRVRDNTSAILAFGELGSVNPKIVSEMLGHANIAITLDTYSHVLPNVQDSAVAAMEEAYS
jgi:hypothetical protein